MLKRPTITAFAAMLILSSLSVSVYMIVKDVEDNSYPFYYASSTDRFKFPRIEDPRPEVLEFLNLSGHYLSKHVEKNGKWDYLYYPDKDESSNDYNILRHAGTTYSMALTFKYTQNLTHYFTTMDTINYLLDTYFHYDKGETGEIAYISDSYRVKLGGAALTSLALVAISEIDPILNYSRELDGMGRFMVEMVTESGKFNCFKDPSHGDHNDYYPGEALLALSRLYEFTGDNYYLDAMERAWDFYLDYYGSGRYTPFTPWGTEALYHMYRFTGEKKYSELAVKMGEYSSMGQHKPDYTNDERFVGGYGSNPRANTASKIEGTVDAERLCRMQGSDDIATNLKSSVKLSLDFLRGLQINRSESVDFPEPDLCLGGVPGSYDDPGIRIDYVQHAAVIFAKTAAYESGLEKV